MRSFLEFVLCCVTTPGVSTTEEVVTAATPTRREETKSLMSPKIEGPGKKKKKKKKRVRVGSTGSTTPEWKPSLYMISEDNVMAEKREKTLPEATSMTADRMVKRKSTEGSRSKIHVRSYSNDIGRNPVPVVIPTFSPTPFMF